MPQGPPSRWRWVTWRNFDSCLIRLAIIGTWGFVGFLTYLILSTKIVPASDADAMVQMAQWTIVTILTGGAALIGINWYQGEKRHEADKEELAATNRDQFKKLEEDIQATAIFTAVTELQRRVGPTGEEGGTSTNALPRIETFLSRLSDGSLLDG